MSRELLAMEEATARIFRQASRAKGLCFEEDPSLTRIESDIPSPWFNCVLQSRLEEQDQAELVAQMADRYSARGVPLLWRLGPATTGRESLRERLRERGFLALPSSTAIVGDLPALLYLLDFLPSSLVCVRVADRETYGRWFGIFARAFDIPPVYLPSFADAAEIAGLHEGAESHNLLLLDRQTPVACATVTWREGEPFASIFNLAVAPDRARSGLGRYMLASAALHLRKRGCHRLGQFSSASALPFYLRVASVRSLGAFESYLLPPRPAEAK